MTTKSRAEQVSRIREVYAKMDPEGQMIMQWMQWMAALPNMVHPVLIDEQRKAESFLKLEMWEIDMNVWKEIIEAFLIEVEERIDYVQSSTIGVDDDGDFSTNCLRNAEWEIFFSGSEDAWYIKEILLEHVQSSAELLRSVLVK